MYSHETKDASIPRERAGSRAPASGDSDGLCKTADADLCGFSLPVINPVHRELTSKL